MVPDSKNLLIKDIEGVYNSQSSSWDELVAQRGVGSRCQIGPAR